MQRLQGMFAFALYDSRRNTLHVGAGPFRYQAAYTTGNPAVSLAFASEVKALVRSGLVSGEQDSRALSVSCCSDRFRRPPLR